MEFYKNRIVRIVLNFILLFVLFSSVIFSAPKKNANKRVNIFNLFYDNYVYSYLFVNNSFYNFEETIYKYYFGNNLNYNLNNKFNNFFKFQYLFSNTLYCLYTKDFFYISLNFNASWIDNIFFNTNYLIENFLSNSSFNKDLVNSDGNKINFLFKFNNIDNSFYNNFNFNTKSEFKESKLRRAEILFFISIPFIYFYIDNLLKLNNYLIYGNFNREFDEYQKRIMYVSFVFFGFDVIYNDIISRSTNE